MIKHSIIKAPWAMLCITFVSMWLTGCAGCGFDEAGCTTDDDCRDDRVCSAGICLDPTSNNSNNQNNTMPDLEEMSTPPDMTTFPDMTQFDTPPDFPPPLDMDRPDLSPPDMNTPDLSPPDMNMPDLSTPDMNDPDLGKPDMNMPDLGDPDMNDPDLGQPDMNMPDIGMPDMGSPDMNMPDLGTPVVGPQIVVTPVPEIDFGNNPVGSMLDVTVEVQNVGDAALNLTSVDLRSRPSTGFDVQPVVSSMTVLLPNQRKLFTATFKPQQNSGYRNFIDIKSNDADDPLIEVELSGRGFNAIQRACLYSSPDAVDFGIVLGGQTVSKTVTVGNCSAQENVTVTEIRLDSRTTMPVSITSSKTVPFTIPVGQSETITLNYAPTTDADLQDELVIRSDSMVSPTSTVDIFGSGGGCPTMIARGESSTDPIAPDALRQGTIVTTVGDSVILDGLESNSPSNQLAYQWRLISAPANSTSSIANASAGSTTLAIDQPGIYRLELDGTDLLTNKSACTIDTIEIVALAAQPTMTASMSWMADHDMDLHILRSDAAGNWPMFADLTDDLHYDNLNADWGMPNVLDDNGFHFGDDADGFGPENAIVTTLESNRKYRVIAHFARRDGFQPFRFTASMTVSVTDAATGNTTTNTANHDLRADQQGQQWIAFDVDGATGVITLVDMTQ